MSSSSRLNRARRPSRRNGATRRSPPTMPNGFWVDCAPSRPRPAMPRRSSPAASPRPTSSSATRYGSPRISGWPGISGPTSPPIGNACKRATATSAPSRRKNGQASSRRWRGGRETLNRQITVAYPPLEGEGRREPDDAKHRPESGGGGRERSRRQVRLRAPPRGGEGRGDRDDAKHRREGGGVG